ncbi:MAG: hypothetical protein FWF29_08350 [Treponema sp.]|nr:hypothetical protein [Treponema sp.]
MVVLQKKLILPMVICLALISLGNLYASPNFMVSPQWEASAGQFWGDADQFMDPRGYVTVEFDKWFGAVSFYGNHQDFSQTAMAQLGFATRFGGIYTGVYYNGNAWNMPQYSYSESQEGAGFFASTKMMKSFTVLPEINTTYRLHNEAAVLIGVADMGFRLSYVSTHRIRNLSEDFKAGDDYYRSFRDEYGSINPELAWGMAKDLIDGKGLKPHVYIDTNFFRDFQALEQYKAGGGTYGNQINNSQNYFTLGLTASTGNFSLVKKDSFDFGCNLWYVMNLQMYNNEYPYQDAAGTYHAGKNLKGTYDGTSITGRSMNTHTITPYLYSNWSGEKLSLSAEFSLGFGFGNAKDTAMALKAGSETQGILVKEGADNNTSGFSFSPVLNAGMQWAIISDKLFLNAGAGVGFGYMVFTTVKTVNYDQGAKDNSIPDSTTFTRNFYPASTTLSAGITFNPVKNLGLQAMCGIDSGTNYISIFDTTAARGFFTFSKLLVTLKF